MTRTEALEALASASTHQRLKAARTLSRNCEPDDLPALRRQRGKETDVYVKGALDRAIRRAARKAPPREAQPATDEAESPEGVRREAHAQAVRWIAGVLLHELQGPIGLVDAAAAREVPNFANSATRARLESVKGRFAAIENLQHAATTAKPTRFDLAAFVDQVLFEELAGAADNVARHGPSPMEVMADPRLLGLAFGNGLRNAVEAAGTAPKDDGRAAIVVSWGQNDIDVWVTIVDAGPGLPLSMERAFEIGQTTKVGHQGFGLAIARQAMDSLGGTVRVSNAQAGGACYELRWEK